MTIDDAARVRIIRAITGMDSKTFALKMGISAGTCTAWEKGRSTPQREKRRELAQFCQKLGIAFLPSGMPVPMSDLVPSQEQ